MQQANFSPDTTNAILVSQASYTALETVFGCYPDQSIQCWEGPNETESAVRAVRFEPRIRCRLLEYVRAPYGLPEAPVVLDMGLRPGTSAGTPKPARVECDRLRTGL